MAPATAEAFASVIGVLPEAVLLITSDGKILCANDPAAAILGLPAEHARGQAMGDFLAEDADTVAMFLRTASRTKPMVPAGLTVKRGKSRVACRCEGAVVVARTATSPAVLLLRMIPKEAAVNRFVSLNLRMDEMGREIARRQQAEQALREQTELLRVTLASIGDAVIATDPAGRVTFANSIAEQLTGWKQPEAVGRTLDEVFRIFNEVTRAPVESPVRRVLREGTVVGLANHTLLAARDGSMRPIDDSGAPIRDASGNVLGVVLVFRDVTERRSFERERVEADRRKDEFLAMLAHELRNPLAPVLTALQLMELRPQDDAVVARSRAVLGRQVRHMTRLVDDLLDVSRITRGKITLRTERGELAALAGRALEAALPLLEGRRLEVSTGVPSGLWVEADPVRMEQVLLNLLTNAAKFTEPGGRVRVWAEGAGDRVRIGVSDNGIGIAPEVLPRIFDLFMQGDRSLDRAQGGLGIGLTLVHRLVEMHGGTVSAASAGPGQGSEFVVELPRASVPAVVSTASAAPARRALFPRRILVVDDNVDAARTLAEALGAWGHEVGVAHDGPSALEEALRTRPDVVLLDIGLPGMDGYEVARLLRERAGLADTVLIALSGYGQADDRRRSQDAGFRDHLVKPVDIEELASRLGGAG
jgi:PAS domain S-box-containing protein